MALRTGQQLQEFFFNYNYSLVYFQWHLLGVFLSVANSGLREPPRCHGWEPCGPRRQTSRHSDDSNTLHCHYLSWEHLSCPLRDVTQPSEALRPPRTDLCLWDNAIIDAIVKSWVVFPSIQWSSNILTYWLIYEYLKCLHILVVSLQTRGAM